MLSQHYNSCLATVLLATAVCDAGDGCDVSVPVVVPRDTGDGCDVSVPVVVPCDAGDRGDVCACCRIM